MSDPNYNRTDRVRETLKREISEILIRDVKDPRLGFVTITDVEMSPDMRYATVFVSVYGAKKKQQETINGLTSAAKYIRREIGDRVRLRHTPEIRFVLDRTLERADKLSRLIAKIQLPSKGLGSRP